MKYLSPDWHRQIILSTPQYTVYTNFLSGRRKHLTSITSLSSSEVEILRENILPVSTKLNHPFYATRHFAVWIVPIFDDEIGPLILFCSLHYFARIEAK